MTNEHMWLQGVVRDLCEQLGYSARLEVNLADVKVESPVPYAVEVQRVSTNLAKRTAQRRANGMKSLWLLPETEKQRDIGRNGMRHDDPLFKHPAVRLRYYWSGRNHKTMVPTQYLNREVWNAGATDKVDLYVAVTLWTLADDRSRFDRSSSMPLRGFLNEVLSGRLEWFTKEQLHGTSNDKRSKWAGWANPEDVQQVVGLRQLKRLEDRRTADAVRRRTFEAKKRREDESESRSPFVEMAPSPVESDASVGSTQRSETPVQPFEKRPGECLGSSDSDYRQGPSAGKQAKLDSRCSRQASWRRFLSFLGF